MEWLKCAALRWFGHMVRINEVDFVKRVHLGGIEGRGVSGRPPVKWMNRANKNWRVSR